MREVIRKIAKHPGAYPLRDDREFSDYRGKVLGLKMDSQGRRTSNKDGEPEGWKVALAMCGRL